jgi:hypothetical protein
VSTIRDDLKAILVLTDGELWPIREFALAAIEKLDEAGLCCPLKQERGRYIAISDPETEAS